MSSVPTPATGLGALGISEKKWQRAVDIISEADGSRITGFLMEVLCSAPDFLRAALVRLLLVYREWNEASGIHEPCGYKDWNDSEFEDLRQTAPELKGVSRTEFAFRGYADELSWAEMCEHGDSLGDRLARISLRHKPSSANEIHSFLHCGRCIDEMPDGVSPREWSRTQTGMTGHGLQVWCLRHDCNVANFLLEPPAMINAEALEPLAHSDGLPS